MQKCGHIDKFDMLFHKTGPSAGQPRGYAFVTYKSVKESMEAIEKLDGCKAGERHLAVRFAKNVNYDELEKQKPKIHIPSLSVGSSSSSSMDKERTIRAIEAKLKMLESRPKEIEINKPLTDGIPIIKKYQYNKNGDSTSTGPHYHKHSSSSSSYKPYNKAHRTNKR
ncbi:RBM18 family protein [Megaselia abdita]